MCGCFFGQFSSGFSVHRRSLGPCSEIVRLMPPIRCVLRALKLLLVLGPDSSTAGFGQKGSPRVVAIFQFVCFPRSSVSRLRLDAIVGSLLLRQECMLCSAMRSRGVGAACRVQVLDLGVMSFDGKDYWSDALRA